MRRLPAAVSLAVLLAGRSSLLVVLDLLAWTAGSTVRMLKAATW